MYKQSQKKNNNFIFNKKGYSKKLYIRETLKKKNTHTYTINLNIYLIIKPTRKEIYYYYYCL